ELTLIQLVDVGVPAIGNVAAGWHDLRHARRGIAVHGRGAKAQALELLARQSGEESGALHRAQPCSDPDRTEIADDRFSGGEVWWHGMEIAGVEPVWIPSLREQLLRLHRIVWVGIYRQRKLHTFQDDVPVDLGGT